MTRMWGVVAAIVTASVGLAVLQTVFEKSNEPPRKPGQLSEPSNHAGEAKQTWEAPLWKKESVLERARRLGQKLKR